MGYTKLKDNINIDLSQFQTDLESFMKDYSVQYAQPVAPIKPSEILSTAVKDYESINILEQDSSTLDILGTHLARIMPAEEVRKVNVCHLCGEQFAVGINDYSTICPDCQKVWKKVKESYNHDPLKPILD